jgi:hypothetical protein
MALETDSHNGVLQDTTALVKGSKLKPVEKR